MATYAVTRNEAALLSRISSHRINKFIATRVISTRRRGRRSLIDVSDVSAIILLGSLPFRTTIATQREIADWARVAGPDDEYALSKTVTVRKPIELAALTDDALEYVRLRDEFVDMSDRNALGDPVISGTRVSVRSLAAVVDAGETESNIRRMYPHVDPRAFKVASIWAKANPRRGRPPLTPDDFVHIPEPKVRGAYIAERRNNR